MEKILSIPQWISRILDNFSRRPIAPAEYEEAIAYLKKGRENVTSVNNLKLLDGYIAELESGLAKAKENK